MMMGNNHCLRNSCYWPGFSLYLSISSCVIARSLEELILLLKRSSRFSIAAETCCLMPDSMLSIFSHGEKAEKTLQKTSINFKST
jgi:hypothetical protein